MKIPSCLILLGLVTTAFAQTNTPPEPKKLVVQTYALSKLSRYYDGQWQGCMVASDGNCYFAASSHSDRHGAGFFRFNPRTKEFAVLAEDITTVCGLNPTNDVPHGKIHSPIVEAHGWIYLSTHLGLYTKDGKERFSGSHILGYELATGKFRDFGVLRPRYTTYSAIGIDPERGWLYAYLIPMHRDDIVKDGSRLVRLDLRSGRVTDLGMVEPGGTDLSGSYWFFVDARGDCWFTIGHENGALFCARAKPGKIERWNNVLPNMRIGPHREGVMRQGDRHWTWASALPDRREAAFTMGLYEWQRESNRSVYYGDEWLWAFDPSKPIANGNAFRRIGYIGPNFLGLALGGNRVYSVQFALGPDHDGSMPPRQPTRAFVRRGSPLHLRSLPLDAGKNALPTDHGMIVDPDGRRALHLEGVAADAEGRVFMVGDFTALPGDKGLLRIHERTMNYREERREMFLAVAELNAK